MAKRNARRFKKVKKVKTPSNTAPDLPRGVIADRNVVEDPGSDVGTLDIEPMEVVKDIEDPVNGAETLITDEEIMEADIEQIKDEVDGMKEEVKVEEVPIVTVGESGEKGIDAVDISKEKEESDMKEENDVGIKGIVIEVKNITKKESPKKVSVRKKINSRFATKFWKGRNFSAFALKERTYPDDLNSIKWEDQSILEAPGITDTGLSSTSTSEPSTEVDESIINKILISEEAGTYNSVDVNEGSAQEISLKHGDSFVYLPSGDASFGIDFNGLTINPYQVTNCDKDGVQVVHTKIVEKGNIIEEESLNYVEVMNEYIGVGGTPKEPGTQFDAELESKNQSFASDLIQGHPSTSQERELKEDKNLESASATNQGSSLYDPYQPLNTYFPIPNIRIHVTGYDKEFLGVAVGKDSGTEEKSENDLGYVAVEVEGEASNDIEEAETSTQVLKTSSKHEHKEPSVQLEMYSDSGSEYSQSSASQRFCDRLFAIIAMTKSFREESSQMSESLKMEVRDLSDSKDKIEVGTGVLESGIEKGSVVEQRGDDSTSLPVSTTFGSPPQVINGLVQDSQEEWTEETKYGTDCDFERLVGTISLPLQEELVDGPRMPLYPEDNIAPNINSPLLTDIVLYRPLVQSHWATFMTSNILVFNGAATHHPTFQALKTITDDISTCKDLVVYAPSTISSD